MTTTAPAVFTAIWYGSRIVTAQYSGHLVCLVGLGRICPAPGVGHNGMTGAASSSAAILSPMHALTAPTPTVVYLALGIDCSAAMRSAFTFHSC
jgi:hypothetical protein